MVLREVLLVSGAVCGDAVYEVEWSHWSLQLEGWRVPSDLSVVRDTNRKQSPDGMSFLACKGS